MESQADILEYTASAQSGRREVMVCFSPMSMSRTEHKIRRGAKIVASVDHGAESKIRLLKTDNGQKTQGPGSIVYWRIMSLERQVSPSMVNSLILRHNKVSRSVADPGFS